MSPGGTTHSGGGQSGRGPAVLPEGYLYQRPRGALVPDFRDPASHVSPAAWAAHQIGEAELFIQSSEFTQATMVAGAWYRGIPSPGFLGVGAITGTSVPDCSNLLRASPPTLLERYELTQFVIGMALGMGSSGSAQTVSTELAFLVNDRVRWVASQSFSLASGVAQANGVYAGDLINPIWLEARDRLSLRVGFSSTLAQASTSGFFVAGQFGAGGIQGDESVIRYRVVPKPPVRRLG